MQSRGKIISTNNSEPFYNHCRADSGFRRVKPENYTPRLLHFHGDKVLYMLVSVCLSDNILINVCVSLLPSD